MPAHPPAGHLEPAQCLSRPPCSPSIRLGISKDHEVAASRHADTPNLGEPVTTEQQSHTPLPWTRAATCRWQRGKPASVPRAEEVPLAAAIRSLWLPAGLLTIKL